MSIGTISGMTASQVTGAVTTPQPTQASNNFPGMDAIKKSIEAGTAKVVTMYPKSVVRNGYWDIDYYSTPLPGMEFIADDSGQTVPSPAVKLLSIDGKLYQPTNDWTFQPQLEPTGGYDEEGQPIMGFKGKYRIRARADNNVFNDMYFGADQSGTLNAYSNQFQSGSNNGGFFGSTPIGGALNDLVQMAQTTAPVWMGAVTSGLLAPEAAAAGEAFDAANLATAGQGAGDIAAGQAAADTGVTVGAPITSGAVDATALPPIDPTTAPPVAQDPFAYTPPTDMGPVTADQVAAQSQQLAQDLYPNAEVVPRSIATQDPFAYTPPADTTPPMNTSSVPTPSAGPSAEVSDSAGSLGSASDLATKTSYDPFGNPVFSDANVPTAGADAMAADNIDVGGGWNPATGTGDAATAEAAAETGVTSSAGLGAPTGVGLPSGLNQVAKALSGSGSGTGSGTGSGSGLTTAGALAGIGGLAGLLALIKSDSSRYGTPGRQNYTGPLSQMRFNPSTYQASAPNPAMFRPQGGVTTVADQIAARQAQAQQASPMAQLMAMSGGAQQSDPMQQMAALAGLNFAKGGSTSKKPEYTPKPKLASMDPWTRAAAEYQNAAYRAQSPVAPTAAPTGPQLGQLNLKAGGELGGYSDGGRMLKGPGDGMSDSIPATIGGKRPARLADGEFVVPADVVSHLGNGSTEAGARELYKMLDKVRQARTGNKKQGKQINPGKFMPK